MPPSENGLYYNSNVNLTAERSGIMKDRVTKNELDRRLKFAANESQTLVAVGVISPVEVFGKAQIFDLRQVCLSIKEKALPGSRIYRHAVRYLESEVR
jgi:hypothetical protein